jgi:glycosyltransferase involved in cell wall biosynthesis
MEVEISVVVPIYNSEKILPELVKRIKAALSTLKQPYELILVNDHSTDHSWQVICQLAKAHPFIKAYTLSQNCKQWKTTLFGLNFAQGKYIITIDDDLEYEPLEITTLYNFLKKSSLDLVYGIPQNKYRLQGKNQQLAVLQKKAMHKLWGSPVTDSFRIFKREILFQNGHFQPNIFIDAYLAKKVSPKKIGYVKTISNKRFAGESNVPLQQRWKLFFLYLKHFSPGWVMFCIIAFTIACAASSILLLKCETGLFIKAISLMSPLVLVALGWIWQRAVSEVHSGKLDFSIVSDFRACNNVQ